MININKIKDFLQEIKTKTQYLQDLAKPITQMHQRNYEKWQRQTDINH